MCHGKSKNISPSSKVRILLWKKCAFNSQVLTGSLNITKIRSCECIIKLHCFKEKLWIYTKCYNIISLWKWLIHVPKIKECIYYDLGAFFNKKTKRISESFSSLAYYLFSRIISFKNCVSCFNFMSIFLKISI